LDTQFKTCIWVKITWLVYHHQAVMWTITSASTFYFLKASFIFWWDVQTCLVITNCCQNMPHSFVLLAAELTRKGTWFNLMMCW
jgi:hypothetical protein